MVHLQERPRVYNEILAHHLRGHRQIALVSGPRQVGKTTTCRSISDAYLNWDNTDDRRRLLRGPAALAEALQLDRLRATIPVVVLDELHKYSKWKTLLKGFFETYGERGARRLGYSPRRVRKEWSALTDEFIELCSTNCNSLKGDCSRKSKCRVLCRLQ